MSGATFELVLLRLRLNLARAPEEEGRAGKQQGENGIENEHLHHARDLFSCPKRDEVAAGQVVPDLTYYINRWWAILLGHSACVMNHCSYVSDAQIAGKDDNDDSKYF